MADPKINQKRKSQVADALNKGRHSVMESQYSTSQGGDGDQ